MATKPKAKPTTPRSGGVFFVRQNTSEKIRRVADKQRWTYTQTLDEMVKAYKE